MKLIDAIVKRLKELLKEKNWTQYRLSIESGVPDSTISMILNKNVKSVTLSTLFDLISAMDFDLKTFFDSPLFSPENIED